ncbi:hypothetical protein [Streptomyces roseolus]|uniref:hypothetical protein n=1 Tax=Streptomyces roseolus TaxID=67358 RepID=UPI001673AC4F|nr:hypothetical protein [Streptomyces roseolus]GGR35489.1 hypothetical protein GCM10010282_30150 [Streptomyces roseolus]
MNPKNTTVAAALVGGYLLGRTRKARLAMGVGLFLAGRKLDPDPRRIGRLIAASPAAGALGEHFRREVVEATKTAATEALAQRTTHLADSLRRRTKALGGGDAEPETTPGTGKTTRRSSPRGRSGGSGRARSSQASGKRSSPSRKPSESRTRKGGGEDDG